MKTAVLPFVLLFFAASAAFAQTGALYEVSLADRIGLSESIVEGRVVSQESFWNAEGTRIYTANKVQLYRVFKGEVAGKTVEVVTPGGRVGLKAQSVTPSLQLVKGEVGVFFLETSQAARDLQRFAGSRVYQPYASVQGFVRYDESRGTARDVFAAYETVDRLHAPMIAALGIPAVREEYVTAARGYKTAQVPVVTSFTPDPITAGTGSVLTINGTGFEAQGSNSTVFFANADNGGAGTTPATPDTEIMSWGDTQIQVKVPTGSGTGTFTVQSNSMTQGSSATSVTVDYNLINVAFQGFKRTILRNKVNGGYALAMSTNTSNAGVDFSTSTAVDPFNRALATWQTDTGFNVRNDGGTTNSNTVAPNDDPDIVMFDNDSNPLAAGVLGRAFSGFSSTNGEDWFVEGIDIQFRRDGTNNVTWNFGPGATQFCCFDFESVALHEIGHTHQLGHIIEPGAVMNFNITNGSDVRALDQVSDIAGGNDVLDFAASKSGGMSRLTGVGVEEEPLAIREGLVVTRAYPNPSSIDAAFSVEADRPQRISVDVYDVLGRRVLQLFEGPVFANSRKTFRIGLTELPAGVYIYAVTGETGERSGTIVLQR